MAVIIDFNGYFTTPEIFVAKEFGIMTPTVDSAGQLIDEKGLFLPCCNWEELETDMQLFYTYIIDKFNGIPWESGSIFVNEQKNIFKHYLKNAKFIIVANTLKKKLLQQIIGDVKEIICMTDLQYDDTDRLETNCPNHLRPNTNCAYDNVAKIKHFLSRTGLTNLINYARQGDTRYLDGPTKSFIEFFVQEAFKDD
ncbi:uncharacterized protein LOC141531724 [Cotesia typhae]|uniref:uncharacterized protein LOC141531724 n=1 Tax=Cotesia typhae TaxID=2053667 RepID=UPI003D68C07E